MANFDFSKVKDLTWDPKRWPNFSRKDGSPEAWMRCRHTGRLAMSPEFLDKLQYFRIHYFPFPMIGTSGYRHPTHPTEARKSGGPGTHSTGRAGDFAVSHQLGFKFLKAAMSSGLFTGIGVHQKGTGRFIHLDDLPEGFQWVRPTIWTY